MKALPVMIQFIRCLEERPLESLDYFSIPETVFSLCVENGMFFLCNDDCNDD